MASLTGKKIAMLVTDGFEQSELEGPKKALEDAGATVLIVSPKAEEVKGWKDKNWGDSFCVDVQLHDANAHDFDALILPGGQMNPDSLRLSKKAIRFISDFYASGKLVAAICHGPWLLIDAGIAPGKTVTSWQTVSTDLINAGAEWIDKEVVVDGNVITSRKPEDIPAFSKAIISSLEGL